MGNDESSQSSQNEPVSTPGYAEDKQPCDARAIADDPSSSLNPDDLSTSNGSPAEGFVGPSPTPSFTDEPPPLEKLWPELYDNHMPISANQDEGDDNDTSVDAVMRDALPTAGNLNKAMNDDSDTVAETLCLIPQTERNTSVTPSQDSSTWNPSPTLKTKYKQSTSSTTPTQNPHAFEQLSSRYGGTSKQELENMQQIMEYSDHFLRKDAVSFIETFVSRCKQSDLWHRHPLSNPITGSSLAERTLQSLRCAETIENDTIMDPVRLRIGRVLLYHYMEQRVHDIRNDRSLPKARSRGKDVRSTVIDLTLTDTYGHDDEPVSNEVSKQRRNNLIAHKTMGRRWSLLASHLGTGILLTCDPKLGAYM
jgi:hypothetical protein